MMTRTREYSNIRILSWPNIRIHFFPTNPSPSGVIYLSRDYGGTPTEIEFGAFEAY